MYFVLGFCFIFIHFVLFSILLFVDRSFALLFTLNLFNFFNLPFSLVFIFDWVSICFSSFVCLISGSIFFYSKYYMGESVLEKRFVYLLVGFVMSMILLVFGGNMFLIMLGWDGLGLISFCLVIFYQSFYSLDSGMITIFSNRIGDIFFLFCFGYFFLLGSFNYNELGLLGQLVGTLFLVGCIAKSAQVPFSAWLPAAMAAPTPVSSLVHSSTLVTAGVYVLVRFNSIFFSFSWLAPISCLTMALAGYVACLEKDLKKVIAMSTLSQLSVMFFSLTLGLWKLAFLHVLLHALYKSLLFLGCGSLMMNISGGQDSRFFGFTFGGVKKICFYTSCFSLVGFPFAVGFFSKDLIILTGIFSMLNIYCNLLFFVGCIFTVFYSLRLVFYGFLLEPFFNNYIENWENFLFSITISLLWIWATLSSYYFSWFCMSEMFFLLRGVDVFSGLNLILITLFIFSLGMFTIYMFFSIFYMRMLSSALFSKTFLNYFYFMSGDLSWLEKLGPRGALQLMFQNSIFMTKYSNWFIFSSLSFILFFTFLNL